MWPMRRKKVATARPAARRRMPTSLGGLWRRVVGSGRRAPARPGPRRARPGRSRTRSGSSPASAATAKGGRRRTPRPGTDRRASRARPAGGFSHLLQRTKRARRTVCVNLICILCPRAVLVLPMLYKEKILYFGFVFPASAFRRFR